MAAFTAIAGLVVAAGTAAYGVGTGLAQGKKSKRRQKEEQIRYANSLEAALENRETSREGTADAMRTANNAAKAARYLRGQIAIGGGSTETAAAGAQKISDSMADEAYRETQSIRNDLRQDNDIRIGLQKEIHNENVKQEELDDQRKRNAISQAVSAGGNIASKIGGVVDAFHDGTSGTSDAQNEINEKTAAQTNSNIDYNTGKLDAQMSDRFDAMTKANTAAASNEWNYSSGNATNGAPNKSVLANSGMTYDTDEHAGEQNYRYNFGTGKWEFNNEGGTV